MEASRAVSVAVNGFGRIGKAFVRAVMQDKTAKQAIAIKAINIGPSSPEHIATFFAYDTVLGKFDGTVSFENNILRIDDQEIQILTHTDPAKLPWKSLAIDWVVEASGHFSTRKKASLHLDAGAKKILITAPMPDEDVTIIPGVNDASYDEKKHTIVSLGSCTTNCFAPIVKVIKERFGIKQGFMTTIHAYTNNQSLLDSQHNDPRRGRAAAQNIIPTNTGADKVITKLYPELHGKLQGVAVRVPVPTVSLVDFTFVAQQELSQLSLNHAFESASQSELKDILCYQREQLVSSDFIGSPYSCIFDSTMTKTQVTMGKVFAWYDNEFGYSSRLKDFLLHK